MKKWFLWGILILALLLRAVGLSNFPVGFTPDEASFGYDAFSLIKTGKDQWGESFPLVFESFGDYKSPLLSYLAIPFVWLFGLTKASITLPNALLGAASVYVVYLLTLELFPKKKILAYLSSFLLAISSWHVMMSRGAFEANLTTFFLPLGVLLFLKGLRERKYLNWSALVFGLNLFTYHSAKLITPLLFVFLTVLYWKKVRKNIKFGIGIFGVFLALTVYTFTLGAGSRAKDISVMGGALVAAAETRIELINEGMNPTLARLLHNKYETAARRFINNYGQYVSPRFLFVDGPAEATYGMLPGRGVFYWFELPFLVAALIYLFKKGFKEKPVLILFFWMLVAPIPAALTMGRGYAGNRSVIMLPSVQILLALGGYYIYEYSKKKLKTKTLQKLLYVSGGVIFFFFACFAKEYFVNSPTLAAPSMLFGRLEMVENLNSYENRQIVVSRRLSEPHIYIAFGNRWDAGDYQKNTVNWDYREANVNWVDQIPEYSLGNYLFKNIEEEDLSSGNILVGKPEEFPVNVVPAKTIYYPDGKPSVVIFDPLMQKYAEVVFRNIL